MRKREANMRRKALNYVVLLDELLQIKYYLFGTGIQISTKSLSLRLRFWVCNLWFREKGSSSLIDYRVLCYICVFLLYFAVFLKT